MSTEDYAEKYQNEEDVDPRIEMSELGFRLERLKVYLKICNDEDRKWIEKELRQVKDRCTVLFGLNAERIRRAGIAHRVADRLAGNGYGRAGEETD
jgi:hypothetical protein